jgi:hypothetical protein
MAVVSVLGAVALWSGEAAAQVPPTGEQATDAGAPTPPANEDMAATVRTENGRRVYVASTTIEVRGEIQRPYAFSVSGRSSLGYSYFEAPIHFIREIVDAVRRAPF